MSSPQEYLRAAKTFEPTDLTSSAFPIDDELPQSELPDPDFPVTSTTKPVYAPFFGINQETGNPFQYPAPPLDSSGGPQAATPLAPKRQASQAAGSGGRAAREHATANLTMKKMAQPPPPPPPPPPSQLPNPPPTASTGRRRCTDNPQSEPTGHLGRRSWRNPAGSTTSSPQPSSRKRQSGKGDDGEDPSD